MIGKANTKNKKKKSKAAFLKEENKGAKVMNIILMVAIVAMAGAFGFILSSLQTQKDELDAKLEDVRIDTDAEKVRTAQLGEQKVYTHTREFIEEQARETYGLLYDGEILFVCGDE